MNTGPARSYGIRIGADVGGTFTDVVLIDATGSVHSRKVPSTPPNFQKAVIEAVGTLLGQLPEGRVSQVAHGTTVATNAVLERRGARTALLTTRCFRDVLELRRIRVPVLYDWFFDKPEELVERRLRLEVSERVSARGEVIASPPESELRELTRQLQRKRVESIAVCFLHSYAYPAHEQVVGRYLRSALPQIPVSLSCQVLPERKEYERTATTVVNAYVRPIVSHYLSRHSPYQPLRDLLRVSEW